ncbi:MAG: hypothetical protein ACKO3F_01910 [Cyanobium sp.]
MELVGLLLQARHGSAGVPLALGHLCQGLARRAELGLAAEQGVTPVLRLVQKLRRCLQVGGLAGQVLQVGVRQLLLVLQQGLIVDADAFLPGLAFAGCGQGRDQGLGRAEAGRRQVGRQAAGQLTGSAGILIALLQRVGQPGQLLLQLALLLQNLARVAAAVGPQGLPQPRLLVGQLGL